MSLTIEYYEGEEILEKCGFGQKMITGDLAFDSSYATGGETLDLSTKLPKKVHIVLIEPKSGYVFEYDYSNKKVKAYYADYDAEADGALIEVANEADLSGVTDVRFVAIGK